MPMMIKGPTGCGKSRFVEHMAWKPGKPLIMVACNEDMTASDLVGRFLLNKDGTRWQDGPLTTAARMGAALRHAGYHLSRQQEKRKLILLVTDGEPADVDE